MIHPGSGTQTVANRFEEVPQYEVEGDKVYETDAYGRVKQRKFIIKTKNSRSK